MGSKPSLSLILIFYYMYYDLIVQDIIVKVEKVSFQTGIKILLRLH